MATHFIPRVGAVFSADIAVDDHEREVRFYSRVLGTGERPLWREDLMNNLGIPIIGLGARVSEYSHLPLQWMPHIQVADVGACARRAVELDGQLLMNDEDDAGTYQWAVLTDLNGAAFGLIPVISMGDLPPTGAADSPPGRIAWLDLTIPDAASTRDFYRDVVGWSVQEVAMKDGGDRYSDYNMLGDDGQPAAGVCHARGVNAALPPVWLIYLPVGDLPESLRRAEAEGGKIIHTMDKKGGGYAYAVVQDPVGAVFALTAG